MCFISVHKLAPAISKLWIATDGSRDDAHQQGEVPTDSSHAGKWKISTRDPATFYKPGHRRVAEDCEISLQGETTAPLMSEKTASVSLTILELYNSL